jgi:hypothetical protein
MIAFDNGPADGDFVRYIDDLMRRGAIAATVGAVMSSSDAGSSTLAKVRERLAAEAARASGAAATTSWTPAGGERERQARYDAAQSTGFATPTAATASASAAAAITSALMSGQMGSRPALAMHTKVGLCAIGIGAALVLIGLLWTPLNVLAMAGGIALIAWSVRMMRDASARLSSASPGTMR